MSDLRKEKHEIKPDKVSVFLYNWEEYNKEFIKVVYDLLGYNPFKLIKIDEKYPYRKHPVKNTILIKLLFVRGNIAFWFSTIFSFINFLFFGILEILRTILYRPIKTIFNLFYYYIDIPRFLGIIGCSVIAVLPFIFALQPVYKLIIPLTMVVVIIVLWGKKIIEFFENLDFYIISSFDYTNLLKYERSEFYWSENKPYKSDFGNLFDGMSMQQAKIKYRNLAKKYHPDNIKTGDKIKFQKITHEYNQYIYYLANPSAYKSKL